MPNKKLRKPVRNFFLKKTLQIKIIITVLTTFLLTSILTTILLTLIYNRKSENGNFYYMSNDAMQNLELTNILGIILPALIIAQIISFLIAIIIGLFSSRQAAIPVYKLERWALQIKQGKLNTHIAFRETVAMKDLTVQCNALADYYKQVFNNIDVAIDNIKECDVYKSAKVAKEIDQIKSTLLKLDFS